MNSKYKRILPGFLATCLLLNNATPASADVITDWNKITLSSAKVAGYNSNLASRIAAIEAIAVYDAVNSIKQFGKPYHYFVPVKEGASAQAAVAQAAHDVLVNYFPAQKGSLDSALATSLGSITDGAAGNGPAIGSAAAADIIALRANDGSNPNVSYTGVANPGIGQYRATPANFAPGVNQQWGNVKPFSIPAGKFKPAAPPAPDSKQFKKALAEVSSIGSVNSTVRTADQTHIAQFYKQDAELVVNEAARVLAIQHGKSLEDNALVFLLADIAEADARIVIWDAKYTYLFWRPVTALNADSTTGAVTNNYAAWLPLVSTPPHPAYPCGHCGTVNAGFEVLKAFYGDKNIIELHTTTAGEPIRTIHSLTEGEEENGWSRIYGGIHYQFEKDAAQKLGNEVAAYVLANGPKKK